MNFPRRIGIVGLGTRVVPPGSARDLQGTAEFRNVEIYVAGEPTLEGYNSGTTKLAQYFNFNVRVQELLLAKLATFELSIIDRIFDEFEGYLACLTGRSLLLE